MQSDKSKSPGLCISSKMKQRKGTHSPLMESKRIQETMINANATSEGELCFRVTCLTIRFFPPLHALARAQHHILQHSVHLLCLLRVP